MKFTLAGNCRYGRIEKPPTEDFRNAFFEGVQYGQGFIGINPEGQEYAYRAGEAWGKINPKWRPYHGVEIIEEAILKAWRSQP